jgi:uncharacterized protein DUF551
MGTEMKWIRVSESFPPPGIVVLVRLLIEGKETFDTMSRQMLYGERYGAGTNWAVEGWIYGESGDPFEKYAEPGDQITHWAFITSPEAASSK